eukprot:3331505-Prymnesium_polylepis.2
MAVDRRVTLCRGGTALRLLLIRCAAQATGWRAQQPTVVHGTARRAGAPHAAGCRAQHDGVAQSACIAAIFDLDE